MKQTYDIFEIESAALRTLTILFYVHIFKPI